MCRECFKQSFRRFLSYEVLTDDVISGLIRRYPPTRYGVLRSDLQLMAKDGARWCRLSRCLVFPPVPSDECPCISRSFSFRRKNRKK